jgi:DNA-binding transcriptional regulator YhcF (GntR family)
MDLPWNDSASLNSLRNIKENNDGKIFLSYEDAASQLALSKSTVKRAFDELQVVGFIVLMRQGV